jgi:hypothetical protein
MVNLFPGATITYVVSATVSPSASGILTNTVLVTAPKNAPDSNPANNSATDADSVESVGDPTVPVEPVNPPTDPELTERNKAFAGLTAEERFVQALYLGELGRAGSKEELAGWVAQLNSPSGAAMVAGGILRSTEARDRRVRGWYVTFLGREAQGSEQQSWVNRLIRGETEEQVLSGILASAEFYGRAQGLSASGTADERYVQALYLLLLNRSGSADEVVGWISALPRLDRQGVALGFLTSSEYRTDLFSDYYADLLHRPADPSIRDAVFSNLDVSGVRVNFESSLEYFLIGG